MFVVFNWEHKVHCPQLVSSANFSWTALFYIAIYYEQSLQLVRNDFHIHRPPEIYLSDLFMALNAHMRK